MTTITVGHKDIGRRLSRLDKSIRRSVHLAIVEAAMIGMRLVAKGAPVDTGRLKQSIRMRRRGPSGGPEIIADAPHAAPVEVGSRPHWAPLGPLVRWVRRHAANFGLAKRAPSMPKKSSNDPKARRREYRAVKRYVSWDNNVVGIARAIQRKIATRGTKPTWFMRKHLPRLREILDDRMKAARATALRGA